jgi:hypothetical protein
MRIPLVVELVVNADVGNKELGVIVSKRYRKDNNTHPAAQLIKRLFTSSPKIGAAQHSWIITMISL